MANDTAVLVERLIEAKVESESDVIRSLRSNAAELDELLALGTRDGTQQARAVHLVEHLHAALGRDYRTDGWYTASRRALGNPVAWRPWRGTSR